MPSWLCGALSLTGLLWPFIDPKLKLKSPQVVPGDWLRLALQGGRPVPLVLGADRHERREERLGYRNGC